MKNINSMFQPNRKIIFALLMILFLLACSPKNQSNPTTQVVNSEQMYEAETLSNQILPPFDESTLVFENTRHNRDEYCGRVFDYHQTDYGTLTIGIEGKMAEPWVSQELAESVINSYINLYNYSPTQVNLPLTVFVLVDPEVSTCDSKDSLVFVTPDELDAKPFVEDLIGAGTGINEYWIQAGLASLVMDEFPNEELLKTWYQNTGDLDIAGLFIARFRESWATEEEVQIAHLSAASLAQYAIEVENIQPNQLVEQVNNEVRTKWLASLGVNRTVNYPYDGRFVDFSYTQSDDCSLIVQAEGMQFCLNRQPTEQYFDDVGDAEFFIDHAYYDRDFLVQTLRSDAPKTYHLLDVEETIEFRVPLRHTHGDKIPDQTGESNNWVLHEILHTFHWIELRTSVALWLVDGFGGYMDNLFPIYQQAYRICILEELNGRMNEVGTSYCYSLEADQLEAAQAWYVSQGGEMVNEVSIDFRLYIDAVVFATIYRDTDGGPLGKSLGEFYEASNPQIVLASQQGLELSFPQTTSFVAYLFETYTMDRVLDVYINHAEDGQLDGKTYEDLKSDWLGDLIARGKGTEVPGMP
jgi:hypothetical protein